MLRASLFETFSRAVPFQPIFAESASPIATTAASIGVLGNFAFVAAVQNVSNALPEFLAFVSESASEVTRVVTIAADNVEICLSAMRFSNDVCLRLGSV